MIEKEVLDSFTDKYALVTGGTGLIGRQVVDILCSTGAKVTSVSMDRLRTNNKAAHITADLTDFQTCKAVTKNIDFVFHIAGIKASLEVTKTKPASHFIPALMFNTNVLEACRINQVKRVLYTSSVGAYASAEVLKESNVDGSPMDLLAGWAKRMGEMQIQAYRIQYGMDNFSIVRPTSCFGPGDNFDPDSAMVIPALMHRIYHGENPVVVWGDGSAIRDFAYSRDVAEGIILALYYGTGSGFVNLGSGKGCSIRELVETLNSFVDFNYEFDATKPSGTPKRVMDITLAKELIHYNPTTSLLEGLRETWNWFTKNQDEYLKRKNYFKE